MFNFGGGTFEVCVLQVRGGAQFEVLAVDGDLELGGRDFDLVLRDHCAERIRREWGGGGDGRDLMASPLGAQRLLDKCEALKIAFGSGDESVR